MSKKSFFLTLIAILIPVLLLPQSVALVMSGGGAKAFTHIGVLQALEENNIPVDYIVGNSMGAMIGGLYAAGYSPDEIQFLLSNPELYAFKRGNTKNDIFTFQQYEDDASWINIPMSLKKGDRVSLSLNVYNIQDLDYLIMEFFAGPSAAAKYNFDSLMIPFRCVATDIDSSRMVILKSGDMAKAVRASLTFPFFIRPIRIDSVLLFDGGMYDNFPVDIAIEEFSPEFVIGSKAVRNFPSPDEDDIISQMQNMLMQKANFKLDTSKSLLIQTSLGTENIFHFEKIEQYIDSGYMAAMREMPLLKEKIKRRQSLYERSLKRAKFICKQPTTAISDVQIQGLNEKQETYFMKSIRMKGGNISVEKFEKQYNRLLANENIRNAYPSMRYIDSLQNFNMNLDIAAEDPFNIKFGGYISSSGVNEAYFYFGYHHLGTSSKHLSVNAYFGTFYNSISGMGKIEFQGKFPMFIKLNALASRINYFTNSNYFFDDRSPAYIIEDENYLDLSFGMPVGLSHVLRAGLANINLNYTYYQNNYFSRTDTADQSNYYFLNPYFEFERNSLNRKQFASKGSYFLLAANYYTGNEHTTPGSTNPNNNEIEVDRNFFVFTARYQHYLNVFKPFNLGISADLVYSNKPLFSNYLSSLLMASAFQPIQLMKSTFVENYRADTYGAIGAQTVFNFFNNFDLRLEGYYFVPYKKILFSSGNESNVEFSAPFSYQYVVGSAQLIYHTPIGPISASMNYFDQPSGKFLFLFNIGFLIFNESRYYR